MTRTGSSLKRYIKERYEAGKGFFPVSAMFLAFCVGSFVYFLVRGMPRDYIMSIAFVLYVPALLLVERLLRVILPSVLAAVIYFMAAGCILGAGYDLFTIIPFFDALLHCITGFVFACIGFAVPKLFVGEPQSGRMLAVCLLFGFFFSLAIAVLWELFEFAGTSLLGFDMQEDTVVNGFGSYLLSGTHSELVQVDGITKTIIYYGDGRTLTIDGYLDIGLIDTIGDMAVCALGTTVYLPVIGASARGKNRLASALVPRVLGRKAPESPETA